MSEQTDLGQLLAAETRLERLVADARAEAARLTAETEAHAGARERALDAELKEEEARLRTRLEEERRGREAAVRAEAEAAAARYEAITDEQVSRIARDVVARVVASS